MEGQINNILKDLYALDPELRQYERELMPLVRELIEAKPDTVFDEAWARALRAQLVARASTPQQRSGFGFLKLFSMKTTYTYGAIIAAVVIVAAVGSFTLNKKDTSFQLASAPEINSVGKNAFGSLLSTGGTGTDVAAESAARALSVDTAPAPEDAGASVAPKGVASMVPAAGYGGGGGDIAVDRMIAPVPYSITYTYNGDEFALDDQEVPVLRRARGTETGSAFVSTLTGFDFGLLNLGSFSSAQMQNISFSENRDFGYVVNINFIDGSISINENWERWNHPSKECRDEACYNSIRLSIADVPADDHVVAIADAFLRDHGIALDAYGEPSVDNQWRTYYEQVDDKADYYIPDAISVKYPLEINGEPVYEQGGSTVGMQVSVNIRFDRVSGVWGLQTQRYESSSYPAITDVKKVVSLVERGGLYGPVYYYDSPEGQEKVSLSLGTPEHVLTKIWNYQNSTQNELLVPALRFPVTNKPNEARYYVPDSIVIPLAEELLKDRIEPPTIMPLGQPELMMRENEAAETGLGDIESAPAESITQ